jgi:hypothetical protein
VLRATTAKRQPSANKRSRGRASRVQHVNERPYSLGRLLSVIAKVDEIASGQRLVNARYESSAHRSHCRKLPIIQKAFPLL